MKIRTTLDDLHAGHSVSPCSPLVVCAQGAFYHPLPDDKMAHSAQEVPSTNFNGLSLSDVSVFSRLRGMDKLHKADAVSHLYKRSLNLVHQVSKGDFLTHYQK